MLWDLSSLALGQFLSLLLGFVAFAYLARTLSPENYGLVEYAVGLAGLAAILVEGGMGPIGALGVSRDHTRAPELAGRIPGARLLLAIVVVPLMGLSTALTGLDSNVRTLTWMFAISLLALPLKQDWLLQGLEQMSAVAPAQVVKSGAFALGVILAVRGRADLVRVGLVEVIAAFLSVAYLLAVQRRLSIPIALDVRWSSTWPLIRAGASVGASNFVWPFMLYAPILLVTKIAGSTEAAWMGGVQRIGVALVSFSALYFFNLYPLIVQALVEDRGRLRRIMASSFRVIAWTSIGVALATTLLAEGIVALVFGAAFLPASPVMALYIWIVPLRLLSGHARWTLLAAERQGVLLFVELVCAATLVALCLMLVPGYGAVGAATAAVLANVVGWWLAHACAQRYVGPLPGARQALAPLAAAALAGLVARGISGQPALGIALAMIVYALCIRLTAPDLLADAVRLAYAKRNTSGVSPMRNA
jgi:O-antigen/teichoic acid export membrane protein